VAMTSTKSTSTKAIEKIVRPGIPTKWHLTRLDFLF
jgi:hypothetical protein